MYNVLWIIEDNNSGVHVMVNTLDSSMVDRGFEPQSDQTKDFKICFCWLSPKYELRSKSKDWLAQNHDIVYKWSEVTCLLTDWCFSKLAL
jgi:hypothetical protein